MKSTSIFNCILASILFNVVYAEVVCAIGRFRPFDTGCIDTDLSTIATAAYSILGTYEDGVLCGDTKWFKQDNCEIQFEMRVQRRYADGETTYGTNYEFYKGLPKTCSYAGNHCYD
ncbi:hypothetical protein Tdes44962_MAKER10113 [Teratosphaeria destructans]|uniref:Uncharacterized protein n=1 Tax=Teratosphaeria destructans TaxID=418781 RepID=A0A9W7SP36_9PEZI|nr:hypothetical protein Tdes44962_MAKER10113 [Teratosphaeria destructans]